MASYASIPFIITREFSDTGELLAFGKVYTYLAGTTIPLGTYQDARGFASNLNPVVLDASGSGDIFLKPQAYKFVFKDSAGNTIRTIDNILGGTLSGGSTFAVVSTYAALRDMTADFDAVLVLSRSRANDGGEGVFAQVSYSADDDGININRGGVTSYRRQGWTTIDPRWFGVVYNDGNAQNGAITAAQNVGATYGTVVVYNGPIFVNSINFGSSLYRFDVGCRFYSASGSIALTLQSEYATIADGAKDIFTTGVTITTDDRFHRRASWFTTLGGSITNAGGKVLSYTLDTWRTIDVNFTIAGELIVERTGRFAFNTVGYGISVGSIRSAPFAEWISFSNTAHIASLNFGKTPAKPEWFQFSSNTDWSNSLWAAFTTGFAELTGSYDVTAPAALPSAVVSSSIPSGITGQSTFSGPALRFLANTTITQLTANGIELYADATARLTVTTLCATECYFNSPVVSLAFATANAYLENCLLFAGISGNLKKTACRNISSDLWETTEANISGAYIAYDRSLTTPISNGQTIDETKVSHLWADNSSGNITVTMSNPILVGVGLRRIAAYSKANTVTINGTFWNGTTITTSVVLGGANSVWADFFPSPASNGWYILRGA